MLRAAGTIIGLGAAANKGNLIQEKPLLKDTQTSDEKLADIHEINKKRNHLQDDKRIQHRLLQLHELIYERQQNRISYYRRNKAHRKTFFLFL